MNATQGTILIMIGALALWLTWSAKSPFSSATQKQIDDAFNKGKADSDSIIDKKTKPGSWGSAVPLPPDSRDRDTKPTSDLSNIKTPLICSALGGTWDYSTNECVRKH